MKSKWNNTSQSYLLILSDLITGCVFVCVLCVFCVCLCVFISSKLSLKQKNTSTENKKRLKYKVRESN